MSSTIGGTKSTCERCRTPLERGDLRCAICGLSSPSEVAEAGQKIAIQVLRCEGCGAAVAYDAKVGAPSCSFCSSVMRLDEISDPPEQTGGFLPFRVTKVEAQGALKLWLADRGFFRPRDLASRATLESLKPLFWVGWIFDARADVTWTADSDLGSQRSSWAPHSGETSMEFNNLLVSASRGLNDDEVDHISDSYTLAEVGPDPHSSPAGSVDLEGALIESFDVQRSLARKRIVRAIERTAAGRVAAHHVPGTRSRKVHASVLLEELETRRLSLPAWVLAYRYEGKLYRAVISGQDAAAITGTSPLSFKRVLLAIGIGLLVILGLVAIILIFSMAA